MNQVMEPVSTDRSQETLLASEFTQDLRSRWDHVQAAFVDRHQQTAVRGTRSSSGYRRRVGRPRSRDGWSLPAAAADPASREYSRTDGPRRRRARGRRLGAD